MTFALDLQETALATQRKFWKNEYLLEFQILSISSEECSNKQGTNDGSCASGFGVCCISKHFVCSFKNSQNLSFKSYLFALQQPCHVEERQVKTVPTLSKQQPPQLPPVHVPTKFVRAPLIYAGWFSYFPFTSSQSKINS